MRGELEMEVMGEKVVMEVVALVLLLVLLLVLVLSLWLNRKMHKYRYPAQDWETGGWHAKAMVTAASKVVVGSSHRVMAAVGVGAIGWPSWRAQREGGLTRARKSLKGAKEP